MGNVLVKWAPHEAISDVFPEENPAELFQKFRPIWIDLNLGKLTEENAIELYANQFNFPKQKIEELMGRLKTHQVHLPESVALLDKLHQSGYKLYSITDNIKEFIVYHLKNSQLLDYFLDVIVSADIGVLKPDSKIYNHLINKHNLVPSESVFLDDAIHNIEGAKAVGLHGIHFTDATFAKTELNKLGVLI
ncbi:MAG: HAD family phosphatase [Sphingobacteriia bacterium]|nr:HAD family phosphatase [Sphingobacteriia bacterium]